MKKPLKFLSLLFFAMTLLVVSCREEESQLIEANPDEVLKSNSTVASLLMRTAMNDGSEDNILYNANCFSFELPITINVNGLEVMVDTQMDLQIVEEIFDEFDDDDDSVEFFFPITIVLADFSEIAINNFSELDDLADDCAGENMFDDDLECADIKYPVTLSVFNTNNEIIDTITLDSDRELYFFVDELDDDDIVNVNFPVTIILYNGTEIEVNNLDQLEEILEDVEDDCDEDDDYDYNDDDCDSCTTDQIVEYLTGCDNWYVKDMERNDIDLEEQYVGYTFSFSSDGGLEAINGTNTYTGTWTNSGSGNNIQMTIDIPDLPDFNLDWFVHELEDEGGEKKIDLRLGDNDELEFRSDCL